LAHALGVTPARINDIVRERRGITAIRHYVWRGTSARMHNRGLTCKPRTISRVAELAAGEAIHRVVKPRRAA